MQRALAALLVLAAGSGAQARSRQPNDLDFLKGTDPNTYATVKALLAKQQLGMLDPRHPSAGFANEGPKLSAEGAASLAKMEAEVQRAKPAPQAAEAAPPQDQSTHDLYPEAGASSQIGLNWRPQTSDDDIVASLGGAPSSGSLLSEEAAVSAPVPEDPSIAPSKNIGGMHIPIIDWGAPRRHAAPLAAVATRAAAARPQAPPAERFNSQANAYGAPGGINFGELIPAAERASAPQAPKAAMAQADTELGMGIDFKSDLPDRKQAPARKAAPAEPVVSNALTNFDFSSGDSDDEARKTSAAQTNVYMSKVDLAPVAKKAEDHTNPYLQMMGEGGEDSAPQAPRAEASLLAGRGRVAGGQGNGYLRAINFAGTRKASSILGQYEQDLS